MSNADAAPGQERTEWLELFFDLVVVAAVGVLSHGLHAEPTLLGLGLFVVLYAGIWLSWVTVVLYANVARSATRTATVVIAMGLVAVMAATAPLHFEDRANAFAVAFLVLRSVTTRASMTTGRMLASWPVLQFGGAAAPWIIAIWVDAPWKYALWALGLLLDIGLVIASRGVDERQVARVNQAFSSQREQEQRREADRVGRVQKRVDKLLAKHPESADDITERAAEHTTPRPLTTPESVDVVEVDTHHLSERLGLLVIIVLGEVVISLVSVASSTQWTRGFIAVVIAAFLLLVGLWWLTFSYGFVGGPYAQLGTLAPRFGLPLHLLTTLGIVGMAAGIAEMAAEPGHALHGVLRWTFCAGLALHFAVIGVSGLVGGAPLHWLLGWALPSVLVPIGLGVLHVPNLGLLWIGFALIMWMAFHDRLTRRSPRLPPSTGQLRP